MRKYFMEKYGMTELGAKHLSKSIFSHTLLNLSKILPPMVGFLFLFQYLGSSAGLSSPPELTLPMYLVMIGLMIFVMFTIARWDYVNLYENVYSESARTRVDIANRLKKLPLSYFGKRDLSDVSATIMSDIELFETIFSHAVPQLYSTAVSTVILAGMILASNWKLGLAVLWVIPFSFLIFKFSKSRQKRAFARSMDAVRAVYDDVQEKADKIREIKAYNLEKQSMAEFIQKMDALQQEKLKTELASSVGVGLSTVFLKLGIVSVAVLGASMLINGEINILYYIAYLMLSMSIYIPIEAILGMFSMLMMMDTVVSRLKEIRTMPIQEGSSDVQIDSFDISFEDVRFGYEDYDVINGVSFTAKQGEVTALIGPSGSGKTTLTKLAARFWDINGGRILLGGKDISLIDPETLLQNFAIVFQEVVLFNASIRDNIKVGKRDASEEEILQAAKIAGCDEFIRRMPEGIDSVIGENGERLSGGERQRISIARAILKDAPVILMDEATASLDVENESLIQEGLSELTKNKTVVVIAHRMRTIRGADKIVLLNHGKVEAIGTHDSLKEESDLYKKMLENS
ncbi:MAG: ABC transporter ATP-binding protein [Bacillota bacterium]|nr:ABC transporter ATP-binding protein [Bacillota bacterium]